MNLRNLIVVVENKKLILNYFTTTKPKKGIKISDWLQRSRYFLQICRTEQLLLLLNDYVRNAAAMNRGELNVN
jgi:hypothetical protein